MAKLYNMNNTVLVELSPKFKDEFGACCDFSAITDIISFDYKDIVDCEKYFSHQNITYLESHLNMFTDISEYEEETEIFSIYPIDMFFIMDITKESDDMLSIVLKVPMGVYTSGKVTGYSISINMYDVELTVFYSFLNDFLNEVKVCPDVTCTSLDS